MAAERNWRLYTADNGTQYRVYVPVYYSSVYASSFWQTSGASTDPKLPKGFRMRRYTLVDPLTGRHRQFPADWKATGEWPILTVALTLPNIDGTTTIWHHAGYISEKMQPQKNTWKR